MSVAVRVENIIDGSSRSEQMELREMIVLEQIRVEASGGKCGISKRRENITDREKSRSKGENKSVVIRSERRMRKVVWSRSEQEVQYRTTHSKDEIQL